MSDYFGEMIQEPALSDIIRDLKQVMAGDDDHSVALSWMMRELEDRQRCLSTTTCTPRQDFPTQEVDINLAFPLSVGEALRAALRSRIPTPIVISGENQRLTLGAANTLCIAAGVDAEFVECTNISRFDQLPGYDPQYPKVRILYRKQRDDDSMFDTLVHPTFLLEAIKHRTSLIIVHDTKDGESQIDAALPCLFAKTEFAARDRRHQAYRLQTAFQSAPNASRIPLIAESGNLEFLKLVADLAGHLETDEPTVLPAVLDMIPVIKPSEAVIAKKRPKTQKEEIRWVEGDDFSLDLLNTSMEPRKILQLCRCSRERHGVRLLFSGGSGTGKSEFVKWLALELGMPLHQRRADEFMYHRLGETERAIRKAFQRAQSQGALLFLDEFEYLVMQRGEGPNASIIAMTTNAILAELDRFTGIVIACTNHPQLIDSAMPRRFTYKVAFRPLRPEDRAIAFEKYLARYGSHLEDGERNAVRSIEGLSLGDIGNVTRQLALEALMPEKLSLTNADIIRNLTDEVRARTGTIAPRVGFTS